MQMGLVGLGRMGGNMRERLRREFDRGHIAVHGRWTEYPSRATGFTVDLERARLVTETAQGYGHALRRGLREASGAA